MLFVMKQLRTMKTGIGLALSGLALGLTAALAQSNSPKPIASTAEQVKFYETQVLPLLQANCYACHSDGATPGGGLRLNSRAAILKGGASGPAVNLQKPQESLIVRAINYDGRQMPPTGKLGQNKI